MSVYLYIFKYMLLHVRSGYMLVVSRSKAPQHNQVIYFSIVVTCFEWDFYAWRRCVWADSNSLFCSAHRCTGGQVMLAHPSSSCWVVSTTSCWPNFVIFFSYTFRKLSHVINMYQHLYIYGSNATRLTRWRVCVCTMWMFYMMMVFVSG